MTIITEVAEVEAASAVLNSSLALIRWRLKRYAKRRLHIDALALCKGMRPVVMVDYGGKMPELQGHLCGFLAHAQKESAIFQKLRIMVIEDMIYLMITEADENSVAMQLPLVQKFFSSIFSDSGLNDNALEHQRSDSVDNPNTSSSKLATSEFAEVIDLSSCLQDFQVTIPTLNGWLLSYPVVYLFGKDRIPDAVYNLSTKSLRIFKVLVRRNISGNYQSQLEELMSFSVPYHLSMEGHDEPWSIDFWHRMQAK